MTYTEVMNMSGINLLQKVFYLLEDVVLNSHREVFKVVMVGFKLLVVGFRVSQHFVIVIDVLLYPDFFFSCHGLESSAWKLSLFQCGKCENVRHHPFFFLCSDGGNAQKDFRQEVIEFMIRTVQFF